MRLSVLRICFLYSCFSCVLYIIIFIRIIRNESELNCDEMCLDMKYRRNDFEGFDNNSGTSDGHYIVPNYVHFLRYGRPEVSFVDAVCILSVIKNQKPDRLFIHSDLKLKGFYWDYLMNNFKIKKIISVKRAPLLKSIFGEEIRLGWRRYHSADLVRLRVLMQYGGVFLDNDVYVVRSLDDFRRYEMSVGWVVKINHMYGLANQAIIANKNARFIKLWYESFRDYNSSEWYWNASLKPTKDILENKPYLVHRETSLLCNDARQDTTALNLYTKNWTEWRQHYAIHILINHQYLVHNFSFSNQARYPVKFDHNNIQLFPATIKDMANDVFPFKDSWLDT